MDKNKEKGHAMTRKIKIIFLVLLAAFLVLGNLYAQETADEAFDKGVAYFRDGRQIILNKIILKPGKMCISQKH